MWRICHLVEIIAVVVLIFLSYFVVDYQRELHAVAVIRDRYQGGVSKQSMFASWHQKFDVSLDDWDSCKRVVAVAVPSSALQSNAPDSTLFVDSLQHLRFLRLLEIYEDDARTTNSADEHSVDCKALESRLPNVSVIWIRLQDKGN